MNPIISHQKVTKLFVKTHPAERKMKTPKTERKKSLTPTDKEYYKQRFKVKLRRYRSCYIRLWYHPEWYSMWQLALKAQKRAESQKFLNTKPIETEKVSVLYTPKNKQKLKSVYHIAKHPTDIHEVDYNLCFMN